MHVVSVGFAAVKGTRHLARPAVRLSAAGAVGDRSLCLIDDAGQVLRTVAHPGLLRVVVTAADLAQVEPTGSGWSPTTGAVAPPSRWSGIRRCRRGWLPPPVCRPRRSGSPGRTRLPWCGGVG
ncbi:hypothetical protein [Arsenicicoccus piscis]|uniref:Uncharacterized protein n=1 Tax=Arsenicicoccus piscis TaxID=673954 RepID=A0ABQ6HQE1_9MICO|nr:hypothetical protein [Arsenicicoccus piscis]GMA20562.1 hypothetical protein GCM10025862_25830 [Arsenicicoccus piscis]